MIHYKPYNVIISHTGIGPASQDNSPAAKAYEERVRILLNAIVHWRTGTALLKSLYAKVPVWIVPYTGDACNAITGPSSSDPMKGPRIQYSPDIYTLDGCGRIPGYRAVESLFHEMVHGSRLTNWGQAISKDALDYMQDYEEFLAVMLTNMFRSEQGAKKLNRDYMTGKLVSQGELEAFLSSRRAYLDALEYFSNDPLVRAMKPLGTPFNPFRDLNRIRANYSPVSEFVKEVKMEDGSHVRATIMEMKRLSQARKP